MVMKILENCSVLQKYDAKRVVLDVMELYIGGMEAMKLIGLIGGMAAGKSTAARLLCDYDEESVLYDADRHVHELMAAGGELVNPVNPIVRWVKQYTGESVLDDKGGIDRNLLRRWVTETNQLDGLEKIVHPCLHKKRNDFLEDMEREGKRIVVLDIPLLCESHLNNLCDLVICVDTPQELRHERLRRRGLGQQEIDVLEARQWSEKKKRAIADVVVRGFDTEEDMKRDLSDVMQQI